MKKVNKKINSLILFISIKLIHITIILNWYIACYYLLNLNIRKLKKIYKKSPTKKNIKVLVFPKSGGLEDLITSQKNYNKGIQYFTMPRSLTRKIFRYFLGENLNDYKYLSSDKVINQKKLLYRKFLIELLKIFKNKFNLTAIISFNLFYKSDREIQEASKIVGIKFFVIQKESVHSPIEEKIIENIYKKNSGKFKGEKVAVYSAAEKKRMVKSGLVNPRDIEVIGCPRLDLAFDYQKIQPNNKQIIYYMIENNRGIPSWLYKIYKKKYIDSFLEFKNDNKKISWKNLNKLVCSQLIRFAKKNPSYKIIFKGKTGIHKRTQLPSILPKNCYYEDGGPGHLFLKSSKIVVCFNSTVVLEAIAANRDIIIPQFKKLDNFTKQFLLKFNFNEFLVKNEKEFENKIQKFSVNYKTKKRLNNNKKKVLSYYLGNIDGNSGKKLNNFLIKNLKS